MSPETTPFWNVGTYEERMGRLRTRLLDGLEVGGRAADEWFAYGPHGTWDQHRRPFTGLRAIIED